MWQQSHVIALDQGSPQADAVAQDKDDFLERAVDGREAGEVFARVHDRGNGLEDRHHRDDDRK